MYYEQLELKTLIMSLLSASPSDQYTLFRQLGGKTPMSEILRAITELQKNNLIHVVSYRKSKRTGLDVPLYSTMARRPKTLDTHSLLAGVISERRIEYEFVGRNLLPRSRKATLLDIGSGGSGLTDAISDFGKKYHLVSIDLAERGCDARMDARSMAVRDGLIDQIICISALEHVGISRSIDDKSGDLKTMGEMFRVLKKGGSAIITVPYGRVSSKFEGRVYDRTALDNIIGDFSVIKKEFYHYDGGKWTKCSRTAAERPDERLPAWLHSAGCACLLLKKR